MPEVAELHGTDEALARLEAAEAAEALESGASPTSGQVEPQAQQPTPPAKQGTENKPDSLPTDTPAAPSGAAKAPEGATTDKTETQKPEDANKSAFAKSNERFDRSWKKHNEDKAAFAAERESFKAQREQFQREQEKLVAERAKASAKFTPENYEAASAEMTQRAQSYELQAKGAEKQAEELEADGKFEQAEQLKAKARELREAAIVQKHHANQAKVQAENLRKNPDPTLAQLQQRTEAQKREWTMKAAAQWPDLVKENSEFQKTVAGHLNALQAQSPELLEFPGIIFHVARLTAAELAAARVPGMEKELGEYKAKVKELEALTAPGGGNGSVTRIPSGDQPLSDEEEGEWLRQQAIARS